VPEEIICTPQFPKWAEAAGGAGHGGGDFFTNHYFADAIRTGQPPHLNVYRGVAMFVVGILAWKSVLDRNNSYDAPDFTREASRRKWANDHWRPMDLDDPHAPPISSRGKRREIHPAGLKIARRIWKRIGHTEPREKAAAAKWQK
jgi:hypothetical protein